MSLGEQYKGLGEEYNHENYGIFSPTSDVLCSLFSVYHRLTEHNSQVKEDIRLRGSQ